MTIPARGEIVARLNGREYTLCLTLGALAHLENALGAESLAGLADRFANGTLRAGELVQIITCGLRGAGNEVTETEVSEMKTDGGAAGFVDIAARLLAATFTPVEAGPA